MKSFRVRLGHASWVCSPRAAHCMRSSTRRQRCPARSRRRRSGADASWPGKDWYQEFGSAELSALIEQASSDNLDLSVARARVAQADARARQAGAAILPSVDAGGNGNYLAGHSVNGSAHETDWAVLLSASYEVDFWGKNRADRALSQPFGGGVARRSGHGGADHAGRRGRRLFSSLVVARTSGDRHLEFECRAEIARRHPGAIRRRSVKSGGAGVAKSGARNRGPGHPGS